MDAKTPDHLMDAWETYRASEAYANDKKWARVSDTAEGAMWVSFKAGWMAARAQPER